MEYKRITENDLVGKGVVGQPDTPALSALEMQNKVEEIVRDVVIPSYNNLVEALTENGKPVQSSDVMLVRIGASGDLQVSVDGVQWQNVADKALEGKADKSNSYTKDQLYTKEETDTKLDKKAEADNVYTKTETDAAIARTVTEIGAGDMQKAVYDTDGDGVVDNAEKLAVARKIGSAAFDGTKDISLEQMGAMPKTDGTALQPTFSWAMSDGGRVELRRAGNEGQYGLSLILAKGDGTKEYFSLVTSNTEGQVLGLAQKYHTHTASQIASGTLPVERGGTGAANAAGALANLGAMPTAGGIFTGEVRADSGASVNARLRNIMVNSSAGTQVSTNFIYMKRK